MDFFGDDPFFGDMHRMMRQQTHAMDDLMMDMMAVPQPRINPRQQMLHDMPRGRAPNAMMPFGFGGLIGGQGGLFGGMHRIMHQMESVRDDALTDPRSHVYTQSTVISMDRSEDGQPRVVEKTNTVHKAGKVKEVRRTLRNSDTGEDAITIGHHIGDKAHVISKKRDRTGQIHEDQQFIGINHDEAHRFDSDWAKETNGGSAGPSNVFLRAIRGDPESRRRNRTPQRPSIVEHKGPIIQEIEDDDEINTQTNKRYKH